MRASAGSLVLVLVLLLACGACRSNPAPSDWLPTAAQARTDPYGAWIVLSLSRDQPDLSGEFLAVDDANVYVLTMDGKVRSVPRDSVREATVARYDSQWAGLAGWSVLGSVTTLTHGWFLILTFPTWVIVGTSATASESRAPLQDVEQAEQWGHARIYARYPAGPPFGMPEWLTPRQTRGPEDGAAAAGSKDLNKAGGPRVVPRVIFASSAAGATARAPLPRAGDSWTYLIKTRFARTNEYTVTVDEVRARSVTELISTPAGGAPRSVQILLDATVADYPGAEFMVPTFAPYLASLASLGEGPAWSDVPFRITSKATTRLSGRVLRQEEIRVPAGQFTAYKVQLVGQWSGTIGQLELDTATAQAFPPVRGSVTVTAWYVPEVGRLAKYSVDYQFAPATIDPVTFELKEYRRTGN